VPTKVLQRVHLQTGGEISFQWLPDNASAEMHLGQTKDPHEFTLQV